MERQYMTPEEAAPILGVTPTYIRIQMKHGLLPIGRAVKSGKGKHFRYMIFPEMLYAFMGRKVEK